MSLAKTIEALIRKAHARAVHEGLRCSNATTARISNEWCLRVASVEVLEHIGLLQICLLLGKFLEWIVGAFSDLLDVAAETGDQWPPGQTHKQG